ncbi:MAG: hypothetical protein ABW139_14295 [Candidatus Thiodiazotropha sp. DIVDIV]
MKDQKKSKKKLSRVEVLLIVLSFALIGGFIGVLVRLFYGSITILPISALMNDIGPAILIGAIVGGILAYKFPRVASVVACSLPVGCEVS